MDEQIGIVIAVAALVVTNIGVMTGLFLWMRSEANSDRRNIQDIQREDRKDMLQISRNLENTVRVIQMDMKEFQNQLIQLGMKK